jgi:hypothetical protein
VSEDFVSGGRQMMGCAGYTLGKGGQLRKKWGEGERDGTFDREEGLADTSGSHRGVSGKDGFLPYPN